MMQTIESAIRQDPYQYLRMNSCAGNFDQKNIREIKKQSTFSGISLHEHRNIFDSVF